MTPIYFIIVATLILLSLPSVAYNISLFQLVKASSGHHGHNGHGSKFLPLSPSSSIAICCAWDNRFSSGQLTYTIIGGDTLSRQAVIDALNEWASNVSGLHFMPVSNTNAADIVVSFQNGGGSSSSSSSSHQDRNGLGSVRGSNGRVDIAGETILHGSSNGLIDGAHITIASGTFGVPIGSDKVKQIALHEIGHALGLGHANFVGDIMAPALNFEKVSISKCDVSAVLSAEQWKLQDTSSTPQLPSTDHVEC